MSFPRKSPRNKHFLGQNKFEACVGSLTHFITHFSDAHMFLCTLTLCRKVHGSDIWDENCLGSCSTFFFFWPEIFYTGSLKELPCILYLDYSDLFFYPIYIYSGPFPTFFPIIKRILQSCFCEISKCFRIRQTLLTGLHSSENSTFVSVPLWKRSPKITLGMEIK